MKTPEEFQEDLSVSIHSIANAITTAKADIERTERKRTALIEDIERETQRLSVEKGLLDGDVKAQREELERLEEMLHENVLEQAELQKDESSN